RIEQQSLSTVDGKTWSLGGLNALTSNAGTYVLSLNNSTVFDGAGNKLQSVASESWDRGSIVVTNLNDSGPGSLRAAIIAANGAAGLDFITFNIPGGGTIKLATQIAIADSVV